MKKHLYFCEVGVLTPPEYEEYGYQIKGFHNEFGFYDENKLTFLSKKKRDEYAENYVNNGVEKTYAILYDIICNVDIESEMEEIKNCLFTEYSLDMSTETITDFFYKKNGKIIRG